MFKPEFVKGPLPHAHGYLVPMEALTADDGDPNLHALFAPGLAAANFLNQP